MSRRKHNVSYIKPDEPKFLRELKEQIGYKEGPTVETKREILPDVTDDDDEVKNEEEPVVVVLNAGDLTAEEAVSFKQRKEEEEASAPADLTKRIIFRKSKPAATESSTEDSSACKRIKKVKRTKAILSFDETEDN